MGTIQSIFNGNSHVVRQLPPQITGLYGKSRAGFPLGFGHASSYVGRGVALIGSVYMIAFVFDFLVLPNYSVVYSSYSIYVTVMLHIEFIH